MLTYRDFVGIQVDIAQPQPVFITDEESVQVLLVVDSTLVKEAVIQILERRLDSKINQEFQNS